MNASVETQENPLSEVIDTSEINDGSGLAAGAQEIVKGAIAGIRKALSTSVKAARTVTDSNRAIAYYSVQLMFGTRDKDGYPIVSMENDKAPEAVTETMNALYNEAYPIPDGATDEEKREIRKLRSDNLTSVRLFRKRVFVPAAVIDYVLANHPWTDEEKALILKPGHLKWDDADKTYPDVVSLKTVPKFMQKPCAEIYKRSGLDVPELFGGPKPGSGNANGNKDKKVTPEAADKVYNEQVSTFTPLRASESILNLVKHYAHNLLGADGITDRDKVALNLHEVGTITNLLAKFSDSKITDKERATLDSLIELPDVLQKLREEMAAASKNPAAAAA